MHALVAELMYVFEHSVPQEESMTGVPALNGLPAPWHEAAVSVKAAHALAAVSMYCPPPTLPHHVPHALSVVLSPATRGRPRRWQRSIEVP